MLDTISCPSKYTNPQFLQIVAFFDSLPVRNCHLRQLRWRKRTSAASFCGQSAASFDIRVTDTDAPSYQNRNPMNVLKASEIEKKNKYGPACEEKHMSFTPLVTSIDGVLAPEFTFFLKRLANGLASKWDRPYSHVMCWVRCRISFAILRATNICIRGTTSKWRSLGVEDGYTIGMAF